MASKDGNTSADDLYGDIDSMFLSHSSQEVTSVPQDDTQSTGPSSTGSHGNDFDMEDGDENEGYNDLDLYNDLLVEQGTKAAESYEEMVAKFSEAMQMIQQLETENATLRDAVNKHEASSRHMQKNFTSLLQTARGEIGRKDKELNTLRSRLSKSPARGRRPFRPESGTTDCSITSIDSNFDPVFASSPSTHAESRPSENSKRIDRVDKDKSGRDSRQTGHTIELAEDEHIGIRSESEKDEWRHSVNKYQGYDKKAASTRKDKHSMFSDFSRDRTESKTSTHKDRPRDRSGNSKSQLRESDRGSDKRESDRQSDKRESDKSCRNSDVRSSGKSHERERTRSKSPPRHDSNDRKRDRESGSRSSRLRSDKQEVSDSRNSSQDEETRKSDLRQRIGSRTMQSPEKRDKRRRSPRIKSISKPKSPERNRNSVENIRNSEKIKASDKQARDAMVRQEEDNKSKSSSGKLSLNEYRRRRSSGLEEKTGKHEQTDRLELKSGCKKDASCTKQKQVEGTDDNRKKIVSTEKNKHDEKDGFDKEKVVCESLGINTNVEKLKRIKDSDSRKVPLDLREKLKQKKLTNKVNRSEDTLNKDSQICHENVREEVSNIISHFKSNQVKLLTEKEASSEQFATKRSNKEAKLSRQPIENLDSDRAFLGSLKASLKNDSITIARMNSLKQLDKEMGSNGSYVPKVLERDRDLISYSDYSDYERTNETSQSDVSNTSVSVSGISASNSKVTVPNSGVIDMVGGLENPLDTSATLSNTNDQSSAYMPSMELSSGALNATISQEPDAPKTSESHVESMTKTLNSLSKTDKATSLSDSIDVDEGNRENNGVGDDVPMNVSDSETIKENVVSDTKKEKMIAKPIIDNENTAIEYSSENEEMEISHSETEIPNNEINEGAKCEKTNDQVVDSSNVKSRHGGSICKVDIEIEQSECDQLDKLKETPCEETPGVRMTRSQTRQKSESKTESSASGEENVAYTEQKNPATKRRLSSENRKKPPTMRRLISETISSVTQIKMSDGTIVTYDNHMGEMTTESSDDETMNVSLDGMKQKACQRQDCTIKISHIHNTGTGFKEREMDAKNTEQDVTVTLCNASDVNDDVDKTNMGNWVDIGDKQSNIDDDTDNDSDIADDANNNDDDDNENDKLFSDSGDSSYVPSGLSPSESESDISSDEKCKLAQISKRYDTYFENGKPRRKSPLKKVTRQSVRNVRPIETKPMEVECKVNKENNCDKNTTSDDSEKVTDAQLEGVEITKQSDIVRLENEPVVNQSVEEMAAKIPQSTIAEQKSVGKSNRCDSMTMEVDEPVKRNKAVSAARTDKENTQQTPEGSDGSFGSNIVTEKTDSDSDGESKSSGSDSSYSDSDNDDSCSSSRSTDSDSSSENSDSEQTDSEIDASEKMNKSKTMVTNRRGIVLNGTDINESSIVTMTTTKHSDTSIADSLENGKSMFFNQTKENGAKSDKISEANTHDHDMPTVAMNKDTQAEANRNELVENPDGSKVQKTDSTTECFNKQHEKRPEVMKDKNSDVDSPEKSARFTISMSRQNNSTGKSVTVINQEQLLSDSTAIKDNVGEEGLLPVESKGVDRSIDRVKTGMADEVDSFDTVQLGIKEGFQGNCETLKRKATTDGKTTVAIDSVVVLNRFKSKDCSDIGDEKQDGNNCERISENTVPEEKSQSTQEPADQQSGGVNVNKEDSKTTAVGDNIKRKTVVSKSKNKTKNEKASISLNKTSPNVSQLQAKPVAEFQSPMATASVLNEKVDRSPLLQRLLSAVQKELACMETKPDSADIDDDAETGVLKHNGEAPDRSDKMEVDENPFEVDVNVDGDDGDINLVNDEQSADDILTVREDGCDNKESAEHETEFGVNVESNTQREIMTKDVDIENVDNNNERTKEVEQETGKKKEGSVTEKNVDILSQKSNKHDEPLQVPCHDTEVSAIKITNLTLRNKECDTKIDKNSENNEESISRPSSNTDNSEVPAPRVDDEMSNKAPTHKADDKKNREVPTTGLSHKSIFGSTDSLSSNSSSSSGSSSSGSSHSSMCSTCLGSSSGSGSSSSDESSKESDSEETTRDYKESSHEEKKGYNKDKTKSTVKTTIKPDGSTSQTEVPQKQGHRSLNEDESIKEYTNQEKANDRTELNKPSGSRRQLHIVIDRIERDKTNKRKPNRNDDAHSKETVKPTGSIIKETEMNQRKTRDKTSIPQGAVSTALKTIHEPKSTTLKTKGQSRYLANKPQIIMDKGSSVISEKQLSISPTKGKMGKLNTHMIEAKNQPASKPENGSSKDEVATEKVDGSSHILLLTSPDKVCKIKVLVSPDKHEKQKVISTTIINKPQEESSKDGFNPYIVDDEALDFVEKNTDSTDVAFIMGCTQKRGYKIKQEAKDSSPEKFKKQAVQVQSSPNKTSRETTSPKSSKSNTDKPLEKRKYPHTLNEKCSNQTLSNRTGKSTRTQQEVEKNEKQRTKRLTEHSTKATMVDTNLDKSMEKCVTKASSRSRQSTHTDSNREALKTNTEKRTKLETVLRRSPRKRPLNKGHSSSLERAKQKLDKCDADIPSNMSAGDSKIQTEGDLTRKSKARGKSLERLPLRRSPREKPSLQSSVMEADLTCSESQTVPVLSEPANARAKQLVFESDQKYETSRHEKANSSHRKKDVNRSKTETKLSTRSSPRKKFKDVSGQELAKPDTMQRKEANKDISNEKALPVKQKSSQALVEEMPEKPKLNIFQQRQLSNMTKEMHKKISKLKADQAELKQKLVHHETDTDKLLQSMSESTTDLKLSSKSSETVMTQAEVHRADIEDEPGPKKKQVNQPDEEVITLSSLGKFTIPKKRQGVSSNSPAKYRKVLSSGIGKHSEKSYLIKPPADTSVKKASSVRCEKGKRQKEKIADTNKNCKQTLYNNGDKKNNGETRSGQTSHKHEIGHFKEGSKSARAHTEGDQSDSSSGSGYLDLSFSYSEDSSSATEDEIQAHPKTTKQAVFGKSNKSSKIQAAKEIRATNGVMLGKNSKPGKNRVTEGIKESKEAVVNANSESDKVAKKRELTKRAIFSSSSSDSEDDEEEERRLEELRRTKRAVFGSSSDTSGNSSKRSMTMTDLGRIRSSEDAEEIIEDAADDSNGHPEMDTATSIDKNAAKSLELSKLEKILFKDSEEENQRHNENTEQPAVSLSKVANKRDGSRKSTKSLEESSQKEWSATLEYRTTRKADESAETLKTKELSKKKYTTFRHEVSEKGKMVSKQVSLNTGRSSSNKKEEHKQHQEMEPGFLVRENRKDMKRQTKARSLRTSPREAVKESRQRQVVIDFHDADEEPTKCSAQTKGSDKNDNHEERPQTTGKSTQKYSAEQRAEGKSSIKHGSYSKDSTERNSLSTSRTEHKAASNCSTEQKLSSKDSTERNSSKTEQKLSSKDSTERNLSSTRRTEHKSASNRSNEQKLSSKDSTERNSSKTERKTSSKDSTERTSSKTEHMLSSKDLGVHNSSSKRRTDDKSASKSTTEQKSSNKSSINHKADDECSTDQVTVGVKSSNYKIVGKKSTNQEAEEQTVEFRVHSTKQHVATDCINKQIKKTDHSDTALKENKTPCKTNEQRTVVGQTSTKKAVDANVWSLDENTMDCVDYDDDMTFDDHHLDMERTKEKSDSSSCDSQIGANNNAEETGEVISDCEIDTEVDTRKSICHSKLNETIEEGEIDSDESEHYEDDKLLLKQGVKSRTESECTPKKQEGHKSSSVIGQNYSPIKFSKTEKKGNESTCKCSSEHCFHQLKKLYSQGRKSARQETGKKVMLKYDSSSTARKSPVRKCTKADNGRRRSRSISPNRHRRRQSSSASPEPKRRRQMSRSPSPRRRSRRRSRSLTPQRSSSRHRSRSRGQRSGHRCGRSRHSSSEYDFSGSEIKSSRKHGRYSSSERSDSRHSRNKRTSSHHGRRNTAFTNDSETDMTDKHKTRKQDRHGKSSTSYKQYSPKRRSVKESRRREPSVSTDDIYNSFSEDGNKRPCARRTPDKRNRKSSRSEKRTKSPLMKLHSGRRYRDYDGTCGKKHMTEGRRSRSFERKRRRSRRSMSISSSESDREKTYHRKKRRAVNNGSSEKENRDRV